MHLAAALLALVASTALATPAPVAACPSAPACPSAAPAATRRITQETVVASLNALLRDEGLSQVATASPLLRYVDLDGDARTEEALVDVLSPEHCDPSGRCVTLILRALPCGRLVPMGHGRWLNPLASRTHGYMDLGETQWSILPFQTAVVRALHWDGRRYRG